MKTNPLYLDDSYLKEIDATILDVQVESEGRWRLILDQTVFYPMGGGQPTDQGILSSAEWNGDVYQVMMKEGEIWHYVTASQAPVVGMHVHGALNWDRRYKHMRIHSAGHIIDFAVFLLGYSPAKLSPIKGDHGKKPYILYNGTVGHDFKDDLQAKTNELVDKDLRFSWLFQPLEELKKEAIYLQPGLPVNKPLRTLRLESVGAVADGGTQVHTTKEIGKIRIDTVEVTDATTTITYSLQ